jgi:hypothetical protein
LLASLVRLSRIREFKQPSNRVRCHIANLNYARLQGTQSYRLSHNWHPLKDSNLRMSESKSDALDQLGEGGINIIMYTYDAKTKDGLHIHLSMSNNNTCYIFVNDIFDNTLIMRYFTEMEPALDFIRSL